MPKTKQTVPTNATTILWTSRAAIRFQLAIRLPGRSAWARSGRASEQRPMGPDDSSSAKRLGVGWSP
jgi:hypothetical protein